MDASEASERVKADKTPGKEQIGTGMVLSTICLAQQLADHFLLCSSRCLRSTVPLMNNCLVD